MPGVGPLDGAQAEVALDFVGLLSREQAPADLALLRREARHRGLQPAPGLLFEQRVQLSGGLRGDVLRDLAILRAVLLAVARPGRVAFCNQPQPGLGVQDLDALGAGRGIRGEGLLDGVVGARPQPQAEPRGQVVEQLAVVLFHVLLIG